ncbi:transposable element Tcb2 transposase [Trichonephila clavipes]|nr:transposable element Tcb2 transposase [Trichonephila clavipes]
MEAEYVSLTEAAKEFIWLKNVIDNKSLNLELSENVMFCDNQAAISFSKSPVENYRTKHIDVRYHFLRNLIYDKKLLGAVDTRRYPRAENWVWRDRNSTRRDDRRIVRQALVDPKVTRSTIRADVGVAIAPQTISRYLAETNLKSKRSFRTLPLIPLTREHRQLRLQWCQARSMWNVTDWQNVVFSDESRFVLGTDDKRVRLWKRPVERYNSPHTVLHHIARTADVMVWVAIYYDFRSTLIVMRGTLTGQRYVEDILRPHVGPFLNGLPGAIF